MIEEIHPRQSKMCCFESWQEKDQVCGRRWWIEWRSGEMSLE